LGSFFVFVVGSSGVLVRFGGVRVRLFLRGHGVVLLKRTGIECAGFPVICAIAHAPYTENSDAHEPKRGECPRENAEQDTDSRLSRGFHVNR
jgi:hypothetical protein